MKKLSLLLIGLVISFLSLASVYADSGDFEGCWGGMMGGSYGLGLGLLGWLFSLSVLVALVLLIVWLIKQIQKK